MQRYVVVGGGIAGHRATMELAKRAPGATICFFSAEKGLPYDRPPLSKEVLNGSKEPVDTILAGAASYTEIGVAYFPDTEIATIDRAKRIVSTANGRLFPYDALLLATGSRPRRLSAAFTGAPEIHYIRTLDDSLALRAKLLPDQKVAVIGGGFIGLEVAAASIARGCRVTVLEALPRILARGMPDNLSDWVRRLHANEGVDIRSSTSVEAIHRDASGMYLRGTGWILQADVVIAGVGVIPNVELATAAKLEVSNGIVVDAFCRTSDPAIFAAGEVTSRPVGIGGRRRIESWKSSAEQGVVAARNMSGTNASFDEIPWLWSDQFDSNIQVIGYPDLAERHEILGDPASKSWTMVSLDNMETIIGGIAINRGQDASKLKRAVRNGASLTFMRPAPTMLAAS